MGAAEPMNFMSIVLSSLSVTWEYGVGAWGAWTPLVVPVTWIWVKRATGRRRRILLFLPWVIVLCVIAMSAANPIIFALNTGRPIGLGLFVAVNIGAVGGLLGTVVSAVRVLVSVSSDSSAWEKALLAVPLVASIALCVGLYAVLVWGDSQAPGAH